jgi:hypothetical protein
MADVLEHFRSGVAPTFESLVRYRRNSRDDESSTQSDKAILRM